MRAFALTVALLAGTAGPALAQGTSASGSGAIHGQNWTMGQDFSQHRQTAPTPGTLAADRALRAERQRQMSRNFDGVGRPVAQMPVPTPVGAR
nr:hypothetical protein [uncultured Roseococcus sp.]